MIRPCAIVIFAFGCAHGATGPTTPEPTAAERAEAEELRTLRARQAEQDAQLRELRTELALARAERAEPAPALPSETVRIGGDAPGAPEATSFDDDDGGEWDAPASELPEEELEPEPRGRRPVLRLYGSATESSDLPDVPVRAIPAAEASGWARASLPGHASAVATTPLPTATMPVAPLAPAAPMPALRAGDPGRTAYRAALGALRAQRFDAALGGFDRFLTDHPGHGLAPNARYWRAELLYIRRDYRQARRAFELYLRRHPRAAKAPDAWLRLSQCHQHMGNRSRAAEALARLRSEHPESVAARSLPGGGA